jgi:hypothetical protein
MAKRVSTRPEWLPASQVADIYSVSGCTSSDFADYVQYWKHNGYFFFDSPDAIRALAREGSIDLEGTTLFYYEVYEREFDDALNEWKPFEPEESFPTKVQVPPEKQPAGYDVVTFSTGTSAECSPLSCNGLATEIETNAHCLLDSLEEAVRLLERGAFRNSEPGPFRIFAVYRVAWR